jgi:hypothetical protein
MVLEQAEAEPLDKVTAGELHMVLLHTLVVVVAVKVLLQLTSMAVQQVVLGQPGQASLVLV